MVPLPDPVTSDERSYPDLHDHIARAREAGCSSTVDRRSTKTPRCTRWCAGSFAAASRREGPQGLPVHQRRRQQGTQIRHSGRWSAGLPATTRFIASAWAAASRRSRPLDQGGANPIKPRLVDERAVPGDRLHGARRSTSRQRPRRHPGADLDAGLGQSRPTPRRRNTSPRIPTPASRTSAIIAG